MDASMGDVALVWEVSNKSLSQKRGRTDSGEEGSTAKHHDQFGPSDTVTERN